VGADDGAAVFQLLSRLRQATDHPYLVLYGPAVARQPETGPVSSRSAGQSDVCGLCQLDVDDVANLVGGG
jgi:hypothetical protein